MAVRQRHYPGRGRATGISGTRRAYDLCAGCGHARVKHLAKFPGGCTATVRQGYEITPAGGRTQFLPCPCPGFHEEG
jgi:hypothetical protein